MPPELEGNIESVTYSHPESGFTVARLRPLDGGPPVTVVGNLFGIRAGERVRVRGSWRHHHAYGRQFKADSHTSTPPVTAEGIEAYLASGLVRGIGSELARRIVSRFGTATLEVIDNNIGRLREIQGIGVKRLRQISESWEAQRRSRRALVGLQSHGLGPALAAKVFRHYGDNSLRVVAASPYRLAADIPGIGFRTADLIAMRGGCAPDDPARIEAALVFLLGRSSEEGHVCCPRSVLLERCAGLLGLDTAKVTAALETACRQGKLSVESALRLNGEQAIYLPAYYQAETDIASHLHRLLNTPRPDSGPEAAGSAPEISLTGEQRRAVACAFTGKLLVITGGPGTGKTTILKSLTRLAAGRGLRVALAAPTGRAAKRLSEATGSPAATIHRLLEYNPQGMSFRRNEQDPLPCDLMIVDEASMVDTVLMSHLLRALPATATLILVGDIHQLPSVGAGNVLQDIIASGKASVIELNEIFRQAAESRIVTNAHRIRRGLLPEESREECDFYFLKQDDPHQVLRIILDLVSRRIPRRFGFDPLRDIQVLTPMKRGQVGVNNLNRSLQALLNPAAGAGDDAEDKSGRLPFRIGDKVMQVRNNYNRETFNGDMGTIAAAGGGVIEVIFDRRRVLYQATEQDELALAYAVSIHKAQGSEFPAVVIPLVTEHYPLLQRNLVYTAVTRARKLVVLVGSRRALQIAVKNDKTRRRYSLLSERLG
jgi:exodeoxyribonuclease V alpha subunit